MSYNRMDESVTPDFQSLMEAEQTEVLRYLEATNSDDLEGATRVMHTFGYDSTRAISHRFGGGTTNRTGQEHTHRPREPTIEQQREVGQYIRHLQAVLRQRTVWRLLSGCLRSTARSVLRKVGGWVLPNCLKERLLMSRFERLHSHVSGVKFEHSSLEEALRKGRYHEKPVLLFVCSPSRADRAMLQLIGNAEVLPIVNSRFVSYGLTWDSDELRQLEQPVQQGRAQILMVYLTIMDKVRHLRTLTFDEKDPPLTAKSFEELVARYRSDRKHEKNILIRYNNLILAQYHDEAATELMEEEIPEDDINYEHDRRLVEEQQKEYERAMEESKIVAERREKEQEVERKRSEELELLKEERKVRKMSIPEEPHEGDLVRLNFRCPDGSTLLRNFPKHEQLELVYHWVETNDEIEFEDDARHFELLAGYPPQPLTDRKLERIASVFEDDRELIVIKEL